MLIQKIMFAQDSTRTAEFNFLKSLPAEEVLKYPGFIPGDFFLKFFFILKTYL